MKSAHPEPAFCTAGGLALSAAAGVAVDCAAALPAASTAMPAAEKNDNERPAIVMIDLVCPASFVAIPKFKPENRNRMLEQRRHIALISVNRCCHREGAASERAIRGISAPPCRSSRNRVLEVLICLVPLAGCSALPGAPSWTTTRPRP